MMTPKIIRTQKLFAIAYDQCMGIAEVSTGVCTPIVSFGPHGNMINMYLNIAPLHDKQNYSYCFWIYF